MVKVRNFKTSFRAAHPDHPDRMLPEDNHGMDDCMVGCGSSTKYVWTCTKGHKYEWKPYHMGDKSKCPKCGTAKNAKNRKLSGYFKISYRTAHPEQPDHILPEDNNGLDDTKIGYSSGISFIWTCQDGHKYWKRPCEMESESKCPECREYKMVKNRKKMGRFKISFREAHPEQPDHMIPEDNEGMDDTMVSRTSNISFIWTCREGHKYNRKPSQMEDESKCSKCKELGEKKRHKMRGRFRTCFRDAYPEQPDRMLPEDNDGLDDTVVGFTSNIQFVWTCQEGHKYKKEPCRMGLESKCEKCRDLKKDQIRKRVGRFKISFRGAYSDFPDRMLPEDNDGLDDSMVGRYSNHTFIWTRPNNSKYEKKPRRMGTNVRYRKRKSVNKAGGHKRLGQFKVSFREAYSDFPDQMLPEDNEGLNDRMVGRYSNHTFIWTRPNGEKYEKKPCCIKVQDTLLKCNKGHKDRRKVSDTSRNNVYQIYEKERKETLLRQPRRFKTSFRDAYPDCPDHMLPEDNEGLDDTMIGKYSHVKYIWTCQRGHKHEDTPADVGRGKTCKKCKKPFRISLREKRPDIADELLPEDNNGVTADDIGSGSKKSMIWTCKRGHKYPKRVSARVRGSQCPYCTNQKILSGFNDVAKKYPRLIKMYHKEKNTVRLDEITSGYKEPLWWECEHGHEYQNTIGAQLQVRDCPVCSGYIVQEGVNDLLTMFPKIAEELDDEKSGFKANEVSYGSGKMGYWNCERGHSYPCTVSNRTALRRGCPYCANRKVLAGYNDLVSNAKHVLQYWDYDNNPDPTTVYWKSQKEYSWNCPYCMDKHMRSVLDVVSGRLCKYHVDMPKIK